MHLERKSSLQLLVKKVISLFVLFKLHDVPLMAASKNMAFKLEVIEVTRQQLSQKLFCKRSKHYLQKNITSILHLYTKMQKYTQMYFSGNSTK